MRRGRAIVGALLAAALLTGQLPPWAGAAAVVERSSLSNGITLVTRQRPGSQVVALDFAVRAGARYEDEGTPSAAHLLEHALLLGTERRPSRDQLLRTITSRGGDLSVLAGREVVDVSVVTALADFDLALDVVHDVVTSSRFDEDALAAERSVILHELDEREDDPETRASDLLLDTVFAGHPLSRRPSGTREGVTSLGADRLRAYWRERLVGGNVVVAVVSGLEHTAVVERLETTFGHLPPGPVPPPNTAAFPVAGPEQLDLAVGTEQAHVLVGAPVPGIGSPDRPPLRVLSSLLKRASGRLFTEIRDRRGLAYSTYAWLAQYGDGGVFFVYAGTEGANADAVLALLQGELARLRDVPVGDTELRNAVGAEIGSQAVNEETSPSEARTLVLEAIFGVPPREVEAERLRAVTAADVQRVARAYLDPGRLTVVVTRPDGEDAS